jgi:hypothetical protein
MCVACTSQGCLSANGTITDVFAEKPTYLAFPSNPKLTTKWSATPTTMCFVGDTLQCTIITIQAKYSSGGGPIPARVALGPLGAKTSSGPFCIACAIDHILFDQKVQGFYTIKLTILIAANGKVTDVNVIDAPTSEIKSQIEQQIRQWIYEPYIMDGEIVNVNLKTQIQVHVMRSR